MSWTRPGRLYRALSMLPRPIFQVEATGNAPFTDERVSSVIMRRGTDGPDEGVNPATCEVRLPFLRPTTVGGDLDVTMTAAAASALAARIGGSSAPLLHRFHGRIGPQEIEDIAPGKRTTTISASSWLTMLSYSRRTYTAGSGASLANAIQYFMLDPLAPLKSLTPPDTSSTLEGDQSGRFRDVAGKLIGDIGMTVLEDRFGNVRVLTRQQRLADAAGYDDVPPLARSQAISPASWGQPFEAYIETYGVEFLTPAGAERLEVADIGGPVLQPTEILDWTHLRLGPDDQWRFIQALQHRRRTNAYSLNSVTIDLLHLISSDDPFHHEQARYLLGLEAGGIVTLAGDWYADLVGVHFATGITERITADEWSLELHLEPYRNIVGLPTPTVRPRVWDQFAGQWDDRTTETWGDPR